jgi:hypothetical protein
MDEGMAKRATTISYDIHDDIMQKKVENILQTASRAWHRLSDKLFPKCLH